MHLLYIVAQLSDAGEYLGDEFGAIQLSASGVPFSLTYDGWSLRLAPRIQPE